MKKLFTLIIGSILLVNVTFNLLAKESVLIDFDKLKANGNGYDPKQSKSLKEVRDDFTNHLMLQKKKEIYDAQPQDKKDMFAAEREASVYIQNMPTLVDYSSVAGSNFTQEEIKRMRVSLAPYNWNIVLNSSASNVVNLKYSKAIEWHSFVPANNMGLFRDDNTDDKEVKQRKAKRFSKRTNSEVEEPGFTVLGVRIRFPETPFNSWALIKPPFEIPAYDDITLDELGNPLPDDKFFAEKGKGNKFLNGKGVIRNVGEIKQIRTRVYGCQYKNSLSILLKDQNSVEREINFPQYLDFDGWKEISWNNPNYIENAQMRTLYVVPLYPSNLPYIKLTGFRIYRQGDQLGGDFVFYIKDVTVVYDEATLERDEPIEHETAWNILYDRTQEAKKREYDKLGQNEILRYIERQKMDKTPIK